MARLREDRVYPKREAFDRCGVGYTKGHELIAEGRLDALKIGAKTVVTADSVARFLESLPKAEIGKGVAGTAPALARRPRKARRPAAPEAA